MDPTTFIILSFEGPGPYAHAGGLGSRVTGLSESLARTLDQPWAAAKQLAALSRVFAPPAALVAGSMA